jgi:peptidoglycan/xylan/chitin deacetylase (PgdA/CDA1 family)
MMKNAFKFMTTTLSFIVIAFTPFWSSNSAMAEEPCRKPLYLTLDTGNMASAELIASTLRKHQIKASFFLANERTPFGNFSLDDAWAAYWRERVREGHAFGNHTFDHVYFPMKSDQDPARQMIKARPQFGAAAGKTLRWSEQDLCSELGRVAERFLAITGAKLDGWWRAPGGKAPGAVFEAGERCGYRHVDWARAGFLGDELPSDRFSNAQLLKNALENIRTGDILMAHLGIWSRQEVFAPTLDPLIDGLKRKGFCFRTLRDHPVFGR